MGGRDGRRRGGHGGRPSGSPSCTLADAYVAKYGEVWRFEVGDGAFGSGGDAATVFRVEADKVLAFAKDPHAQTTFRFGGR